MVPIIMRSDILILQKFTFISQFISLSKNRTKKEKNSDCFPAKKKKEKNVKMVPIFDFK